jgi:hypothetical protein
MIGEETPWATATRGVVTIEKAGEVLRGHFWADTPAGPVEGKFNVKRHLVST